MKSLTKCNPLVCFNYTNNKLNRRKFELVYFFLLIDALFTGIIWLRFVKEIDYLPMEYFDKNPWFPRN